jgi:hypothetical protein
MKKRLSILVPAAFLLAVFIGAEAQNPQPSPQASPSPAAPAAAARPGDVDSIDHIVAAVYDVISGPAGPRDWQRFRGFFYSGAHMASTRQQENGPASVRVFTPDDYATRSQDYFSKESFFENSVSNHVENWGNIAHVWSTYESRHARGEKPFARGINSFQLFNDGSRWWVLTIYWQQEDAAHPLPEKYLK